ncbi:MAG: tail fiber domain-containing protein [Verrucomicrobiota bacterium]|jgi:hypothetical protein
MKTKHHITQWLVLLALSTLSPLLTTALAQGTAFTYQGRLNDGNCHATGLYDFQFEVFDAASGGNQQGTTLTRLMVPVTNGLFTVTLDFSPGASPGVFPGDARWLDISARTNGASSFTALTPRQPLLPTPYAITAENLTGLLPASQLSGTVGNSQLANNSVTVNAGTGLSGGGLIVLGGSKTLNNAGVLSVAGNDDITVATMNGAVTLGDTAIDADIPDAIVKRDDNGNFSADTITLDANLNLPATTATAGIIYSGANTLLHVAGYQNFFAGAGAGNLTLTGYQNTGVGYQSLSSDTYGAQNSAFGYHTLYYNTVGSYNTAIGFDALIYNTSGSNNTASGQLALFNNTSGAYNTADGVTALYNNTNGWYNTANGNSALFSNTSGSNNTANGVCALFSNTTGAYNTAVGLSALFNNTIGYHNTANGVWALVNNTIAFENTANGYQALFNNTNGAYNTASGSQALFSNTSGSDNAANGYQALYSNTTANDNTADGVGALYSNTTGTGNTASGQGALYYNTNGNYNTASGQSALLNNTSGYYNTADGALALENTTSGYWNTAIGANALYDNSSGYGNTAIGEEALYYNSGSENIALGNVAGFNLTYGNNNIDIGNRGVAAESATIRIGTPGTQTSTYIAGISGVTISPAGSAVYVNSSGQLGTVNSSRRFKEAIQDMGSQSDALLALRPVAFRYKHDLDPQGTPQFGLIAEEVEKVAPELVLHDTQGRVYSVRYEQVNAMLLNEFLKEHNRVKDLESRIEKLERILEQQTTKP